MDVVAEHVVTVTGAPQPLELSMQTASNPVQASGRLYHTITVSNVSLLPVDNVWVTLRVPDGESFHYWYEATPDLWSCTSGTICADGAETYWQIGTLEAGGSRTLVIQGNVAPTAPAGTLLTMTALVEADGLTDTIVLRDTARVSSQAVSELSLGATPEPVLPGGEVTVEVDAGNVGATALGNAEVRLRIPAGATVTSISDGGTEDTVTGEIVWSLGSVAVGGSVHREAVLTLDTGARPGEAIALHAELRHDGGAAVDVVAEHVVTVTDVPQPLDLTATISPEPVTAGQVVTYTMVVTNTSLVPVDGIWVYVRLPDGVSFHWSSDANPSAYSCTSGSTCSDGAEAIWNVGTLNAGASMTITVNATVSAATPAGSLLPFFALVEGAGVTDGILNRIVGRVQ